MTEIISNQNSAKIIPNSVLCLTWVHTPWYVIKDFPLYEFHTNKMLIPFVCSHRTPPPKFVSRVRVMYTGNAFLPLSFLFPPRHTSLSDLSASPFHYQRTLHKCIGVSSTRRTYILSPDRCMNSTWQSMCHIRQRTLTYHFWSCDRLTFVLSDVLHRKEKTPNKGITPTSIRKNTVPNICSVSCHCESLCSPGQICQFG
jgi:hypothetical protein